MSDEPLDPARFRQAMGRLVAGVSVLTTFAEGPRPRDDGRHPHLGLARPPARARLRRDRDPLARRRARGRGLRRQRAGRRPAPALATGSPPGAGPLHGQLDRAPHHRGRGHRRRAARRRADAPRVPHHRHPPGRRPRDRRRGGRCRSPCPTPSDRPWSTSEDATGASHDPGHACTTRSTGRSRPPGRRRWPLVVGGRAARPRSPSTSWPPSGSVTACRAAPPSPGSPWAARVPTRPRATLDRSPRRRRRPSRRPRPPSAGKVDDLADGARAARSTSTPPSTASSASRWPRPRVAPPRRAGRREPAVVTVDDGPPSRPPSTRLAASSTPSRSRAAISLKGGKVTVKEPVTGTTTDVAGTADAVRRWWPGDAHRRGRRARGAPEGDRRRADPGAQRVRRRRGLGPGHRVGERQDLHPRAEGVRPRHRADRRRVGHASRPRADPKKLAALVHAAAEDGRRRGRGQGRRRDLLRPHAHRPPARGGRRPRRRLDRHARCGRRSPRRRAPRPSRRRRPSRSSPRRSRRRRCPRRRSPPSRRGSPSASRACTTSGWPRASSTAPTSPRASSSA